MKRRHFVSIAGVGVLAKACAPAKTPAPAPEQPLVISTWAPNVKANEAAWAVLSAGGHALDAVHHGVMVPEADPDDQSVGYGGLPDRDGRVTCDSCIMDEKGNIGAVMCLEHILHAVSVARLVMEKTPHVQLVGDGALQFALANGFQKQNMLTEKSEKAWREWLKTSKYNPMTTVDNILEKVNQNHDTIGMLALDAQNRLCGACTTSGMAYKMHGRVGDSPIIGAGLYVDDRVGAATATGVGEEVVRIVGSHTVVEGMRYGLSPEAACKEAVKRIVEMRGEKIARTLQVGFIALNKKGEYGCYSLTGSFTAAVRTRSGSHIIASKSLLS